jgi:hypothetical protein
VSRIERSDGIVVDLHRRRIKAAGIDGWLIGLNTAAVEELGWEWAEETVKAEAAAIEEPHGEPELCTPTEGFFKQRWYVKHEGKRHERLPELQEESRRGVFTGSPGA